MRSPQNTAAIRADEEPRCDSSNDEYDAPGGTSCGVVEKRIEPREGMCGRGRRGNWLNLACGFIWRRFNKP